MVYSGKPSAGCENCRKARKRCDQGMPSCERCVRLGKQCGGYRDLNDLVFRNETSSVARRAASATGIDCSMSKLAIQRSSSRQPSPSRDAVAMQFFFDQFVTEHHLSFLRGATLNDFLLKPVMACALSAMANRTHDAVGRERSRRYYVDALTATNEAIQQRQQTRSDDTLIAISLLSCYERISWDMHASSWRSHIEGAAEVLWLRGPGQISTSKGVAIFRELRDSIVNNCYLSERAVPDYITEWTRLLEFDPILTPSDHITLLASRGAALRSAFRNGLRTDSELLSIADALETDFLQWAKRHSVKGSVCAFETVNDRHLSRSWDGLRHIYGSVQAKKHWTRWWCARILVSRIQEAIWRRSWPMLASPGRPVPAPLHFKAIRQEMVDEICISTAHDFGNDNSIEPPSGSVASGLVLLFALTLAGITLSEQLSEQSGSPGDAHVIHLSRPVHLDLFDSRSTQLAWIIERIDYIAEKVGIRWAATISQVLKGEMGVHFDVSRSHILENEELDAAIFGESPDLETSQWSFG